MAGKKSGGKPKSNKKKGKKGDGSHIAAGIMPTAMFAAVPRTPPPPREAPDFGLGINSALLNSSMLTRMFASPEIPDDHPLSDTDTSLFDYDRRYVDHVDPGYSVVEFSHDPMPTPPNEFRDNAWQDPVEDVMVHRSQEPVYSSIRRQFKPEEEVENAHSSLGRHSLQGSGRSRRSGRRSGTPEEMLEAQMVDRHQMASPGQVSVNAELSHSESPKIQSLKEQNLRLFQQQQQIQEQLHEQQELQQQFMMQLQQKGMMTSQQLGDDEMGTLLQNTQTITDQANQQQSTLVRALNDRADVLETHNQELQDMNEQLQAEILSLRRMSSYKDDDMASTQTSLLKKQLTEYKEENNTLKSAVTRLNTELSRYQAKYRLLTSAEKDDLPGLPARGPKPPWLVNYKYLAPLFMSYDDHMREKDAQLHAYHGEMDDLRLRVDEVVKENQRLHLRIEQSDISGPTSMTEWRQLQEQCKLVLEENQLLMEQLDVQQGKGRDMHKAHIQEVAKLSQRVVGSEAEKQQLESEVVDLRERMSMVKREHDTAVVENRSKLDIEEHLNQLNELKRTLGDVKSRHSQEIDALKEKLQISDIEKRSLAAEMQEVKAEKKKLGTELNSQQKSQRKYQRKLLLLQKAVEDAEVKEQTAEHYLGSLVRVAEKTAAERDSYADAMEKEQKQKKVAITRLMTGSLTLGQMEEKLKVYKSKATDKLEKAANRMKDQDEDFNRQRQEYEREVRHLRLLLQEKDEILRSMSGDKRQIEANLETLWQVATADNRRMKDDMQKSIRKLEGHCLGSMHEREDSNILNNSDHQLLLDEIE